MVGKLILLLPGDKVADDPQVEPCLKSQTETTPITVKTLRCKCPILQTNN